jgi:hypothetical protein
MYLQPRGAQPCEGKGSYRHRFLTGVHARRNAGVEAQTWRAFEYRRLPPSAHCLPPSAFTPPPALRSAPAAPPWSLRAIPSAGLSVGQTLLAVRFCFQPSRRVPAGAPHVVIPNPAAPFADGGEGSAVRLSAVRLSPYTQPQQTRWCFTAPRHRIARLTQYSNLGVTPNGSRQREELRIESPSQAQN